MKALNDKIQLVLGAQWGDEGKGKIVDILSENADWVVRYQGGHNAGHTVKFEDKTFILHLVPSGILRENCKCVIGNGVVVHPDSLLKEVEHLEAHGINVFDRLYLSRYAHIILPHHILIDNALEKNADSLTIGTTGRGIGPAYTDKTARKGLRMQDLLDEKKLREKVRELTENANLTLDRMFGIKGINYTDVLDELKRFHSVFINAVTDTAGLLHKAANSGQSILIEGAQGTMLDVDFGTYPFVTSSNTTIGGVSSGLGLSLRSVGEIIGICKAYTTRVGNGPFPTEITGSEGENLRQLGGEYGATTGRPRRCGWFDAVAVGYAVQLNDMNSLVLTKLDVLETLDEIKICTSYKYNNQTLNNWTEFCAFWEDAEPVYETMPGWKQPLSGCSSMDDLPNEAKKYLGRISDLIQVPYKMISTGPGREQIIWTK